MDRSFYFVGIAFFGMINGLFSPLMPVAYVFSTALMSEPLFDSQAAVFYFASLMLSTATVILGGIPAALYERAKGAEDSTPASLFIWLVGTALLTLPAVGSFLAIGL
ncbi:hypothetical protein PQJ75_06730 [Rhodoplanes sp. TEM]|uniref:MFS transporter n=1 Tax=Rhodoplanes tepidamans TaxID=200616 RepID=A0ABT5JGM9_RHOTP|nr:MULTISPECIES: hypothetical protein [Rhodoplanes]MDC7788737.1 hypothetical protein [Rhodoplanes tepidamans]MDC7983422.1 hypothetical protein [Rhodoplanes sp. TEM]MDQ0354558.1 hypothetical protein [Rhodoplanes tepidamans]